MPAHTRQTQRKATTLLGSSNADSVKPSRRRATTTIPHSEDPDVTSDCARSQRSTRRQSRAADPTDPEAASPVDTLLGKHTRPKTKPAEPAVSIEPPKKRSRLGAKNARQKDIPPPATIYPSEAQSALSSSPDRRTHSTRGRYSTDPVFQPSDNSSSNDSDEDNEDDDDEDDDNDSGQGGAYKGSVTNNDFDTGRTESTDQLHHGRLAKKLALEIPTITIMEPPTTASPAAQSAALSTPCVSNTVNGGGGGDDKESPSSATALIAGDSRWPKDTDIRYP